MALRGWPRSPCSCCSDLLATPSQFSSVAVPAIVLSLILIFVARPLAIWICLLPFGFSRRETAFLAWVGLRGATSILLSIVPILGGIVVGHDIFNITFIVVLDLARSCRAGRSNR